MPACSSVHFLCHNCPVAGYAIVIWINCTNSLPVHADLEPHPPCPLNVPTLSNRGVVQLISVWIHASFGLFPALHWSFWMAKVCSCVTPWICAVGWQLCAVVSVGDKWRELVKTGYPRSAQEIWPWFVGLERQGASLLAFVISLTCWLFVGDMQDWWWTLGI